MLRYRAVPTPERLAARLPDEIGVEAPMSRPPNTPQRDEASVMHGGNAATAFGFDHGIRRRIAWTVSISICTIQNWR